MDNTGRQYTVLIDEETHDTLAGHAAFLAKVSPPAARRLINQVYDDIASLDHNPTRFERHDNELYPPGGDYRCMLTAKRYKIIYEVVDELDIVFVVNVIDCRMDETNE